MSVLAESHKGMLASAATVSLVAKALREHKLELSVVDPVMVATSGAQLLPEKAVRTLCEELLPVTYLLTPNIPEANLILKEAGQPPIEVSNEKGLKQLAAAVQKLGPKYVLLKGGHLPLTLDDSIAKTGTEKEVVVNVLYGQNLETTVKLPYQQSRNTHGTGCSLACKRCSWFGTSKRSLTSVQRP